MADVFDLNTYLENTRVEAMTPIRLGCAPIRRGKTQDLLLWVQYAVREGGHAGLSRWREAPQRLQTRPMASAASRYAYWKLFGLLRLQGDHAEADGLLCRRLLRASFRLDGGQIVAWEPPPQVL
ncbi:MAG: hypothetical protein AB7S38_15040 [Vulcanimicrobiota bacterium]